MTDNSVSTENNTNKTAETEMKAEAFNSEKFENGGAKVKGFRNWTQSMEVDLIETKANVLKGMDFRFNRKSAVCLLPCCL